MDVQISQQTPIRVVMIRHTGSYDGIGAAFDQLWGWVENHQVDVKRTIGIYYDNPDFTPVNQLRSAACVEVSAYFNLSVTDNLPLEVAELPGGNYATTKYVGPYDGLGPVWTLFTEQIETRMGKKIRDNDAAFEVYVNDPSDTPESQLITELYMPLV